MPALVYLLHRSEPRLAKIGICEDGPYNRRLEGRTRNGWEVAHTLTFQVGLHARLLESAIKRLWFKERAWADGPARGEAWFDGYTETVLLDDPGRSQPWTKLTLFSLWTDVRGQAERLGFTMDERRAAAQVEGADVLA